MKSSAGFSTIHDAERSLSQEVSTLVDISTKTGRDWKDDGMLNGIQRLAFGLLVFGVMVPAVVKADMVIPGEPYPDYFHSPSFYRRYENMTLFWRDLVLGITTTLVVELPIYYSFGFRTKKDLSKVGVVNVLSVVGAYMLLLFGGRELWFWAAAETLVIVGEYLVLRRICRDINPKTVRNAVVAGNLASAAIGFVTM